MSRASHFQTAALSTRTRTMDSSKTTAAMMKVRQVPLTWDKSTYLAIVMDGVFSEQECKDFIARSEQKGYEAALVNIGGGRQMQANHIRNNDRCIIDDPEWAAEMWKRILEALDGVDAESTKDDMRLHKLKKFIDEGKEWHAVGLNERLRILRYDPGTYFKPHFDGSYVRDLEAGEERRGETSFVTCQLYLNQDFEGGATKFQPGSFENMWSTNSTRSEDEYNVFPKTGSILLFQHNLLHQGAPVLSGRKYVIRTDVMYTDDKTPGKEYSTLPIVLSQKKPQSVVPDRPTKTKKPRRGGDW